MKPSVDEFLTALQPHGGEFLEDKMWEMLWTLDTGVYLKCGKPAFKDIRWIKTPTSVRPEKLTNEPVRLFYDEPLQVDSSR